MRTRADLEKLINNSPLFSIDRAANGELFVIEERRFLADLAELMLIVRHDFDEIGYEIIVTARACIKAYKIDCGVFLNYFNTALKKTLFTEKAKEEIANIRSGLTLDQKTDRTIRQILKYAKSCGGDIHNSEFANKIAKALNIPPVQVHEAIAVNAGMAVVSGNKAIIAKDGEENELFDFIAGELSTPEETAISRDKIRNTILSIDAVFQQQQERTKPLLSQLLTMRLLKAINEIQFLDEIAYKIAFLDREIYTNYLKNHYLPTAREIAEAHGKDEAHTSRVIKTFLEKIPINC